MIRPNDLLHTAARPWFLAAVLSASAGGALLFTQSAASQDSGASHKSDLKAEQGSDDKKASGETQRLIETLGSADFAQRDKAIDKLRALGDKAVPALEDASKNAKDSEVRWNARRVLREIRDDAVSAKAPRAPRSEKSRPSDPNDRDDLSIPLQDLSPGIAIARGGQAPIDVERLQQELQKRMEEMVRRQMQLQGIEPGSSMPSLDWLRSQGGNTIRLNGGRIDGGGASTEIRMENGNVKVSIRKTDKDGKEETKTYEAPSMEEFKEKYPEVAKEYLGNVRILSQGGKLGLNLGAGARAKAQDKSKSMDHDIDQDEDSDSDMDFDSSMDLDSMNGIDLGKAGSLVLGSRPFGGSADVARLIGPENGERLGVAVRAAGGELTDFLGIPAGSGFLVNSVEPGSEGEALGLKVNDLVVSIDGKIIGKDSTVREALASVPAGKTLKVEVIRGAEGKKTLQTEKRAVDANPKDAKPKNSAPKRAQR